MNDKTRIAHLTGPRATIQNTPPLVTSNKARLKHGLPPRLNPDDTMPVFDALRARRLAAPVTVYVERFSAHPMEADAAELYGPPDGYLDTAGAFHRERRGEADKPVYEVELRPEDGLYPLPYMAVQADGRAWEEECAHPGAPEAQARQGFYPDGACSFEEIDRLSVRENGLASAISSVATVDFYRSAPLAGYTKGLPAALRTDVGTGNIEPERRGRDFFPYKPFHLAAAPPRSVLARIANDTQAVAASGRYDGLLWTQGSPQIEEAAYWLGLLVDTTLPICVTAAQRQNGSISNDGPKNIADCVNLIASRCWADDDGHDRCGVVVVQDQQLFAARDVAKLDSRLGGFGATGGAIGEVSHLGRFTLTQPSIRKHGFRSDVNITRLPATVLAVRRGETGLERVPVAVKDAGRLLPEAIPSVSISRDDSYCDGVPGAPSDPALAASLEHKLAARRLAGFVAEGLVPQGSSPSQAQEAMLLRTVFSGVPVARAARTATHCFVDRHPYFIAASKLTAAKARLLLMACLLKFGSLPPARDPTAPTPDEQAASRAAIAQYQAVFDTH